MGVKCKQKKTGRIGASHWVTVYGMTPDKSTWLIHDPGSSVAGTGANGGFGGKTGTLRDLYGDQFCEVRQYSGREFTFVTETGLRIKFHSPVELLITDPQGRKLGDDPVALRFFDEIPDSYYDSIGLEDDDTGTDPTDPGKSLYIPRAASGQYTLNVTGLDTSAYSADFVALDSNGVKTEMSLKNIPIGLNEVQTFNINYSSTPGQTIQVTGGFDGGGQNPASVNTFLSYSKLASSRTTLPAGTQTYTIVIFYSPVVMPGTFSATLNGSNVTSMFHPQPGTSEAVAVPLQAGRNLLDLQIQGSLPNRVATDTDRLVFDVQ